MRHDDDDDFDDDDQDDILQDGERLRVPIQMLDSVQRSVARYMTAGRGHRPGFILDDDSDDGQYDVEDAREEYIRFLQDAHRTNTTFDLSPRAPTSLADAKREAERAYDERSEWLRNAHKGQQP